MALRACLKIVFWVEQATGLLRRATSPPGLLAAGCRQTQAGSLAGSPFHPFFRQALREREPRSKDFVGSSGAGRSSIRMVCSLPINLTQPRITRITRIRPFSICEIRGIRGQRICSGGQYASFDRRILPLRERARVRGNAVTQSLEAVWHSVAQDHRSRTLVKAGEC